jgi:hypothetical protein
MKMTRRGTHNVYVFVNKKLSRTVGIFAIRPHDTRWISKARGPHRRNNTISFSTQHYSISVANLRNCCNRTQTFVMVMPKECSARKLRIDSGCLQRYFREKSTPAIIKFVQEWKKVLNMCT